MRLSDSFDWEESGCLSVESGVEESWGFDHNRRGVERHGKEFFIIRRLLFYSKHISFIILSECLSMSLD